MKIIFRLLLVSLLLSACASPSNSAEVSDSADPCAANLGITSSSTGKESLGILLKNSVGVADENGLVETYFKNSKESGVQVYDPTRSGTIALGYESITDGTYEGFYHIDWMELYGYANDIKKTNESNVDMQSASNFMATFKKSKSTNFEKTLVFADCLLTEVRYVYKGAKWNVDLEYSVTAEGTKILDRVWQQISGENADGTLAIQNVAVSVDGLIDDFPSEVSGFELFSQTDVLEWRLFQGDDYWVPIEEYQFSSMNSCADQYWVLRWKSVNPDIEIKLNVGSVMVEDFMTGDVTAEGGRGYAAGYGCYAPGMKFGNIIGRNSGNLVDIYYEYQIWNEKPSI